MSDVFVSYKAEDRRRVKPLVDALAAEGFSVWWDEQIGGGAAWRQAIETELNAAKCVIVVWSKRSIGPEGTFVQDEATRAQQRHVYVPVLIDKVHLPLGFGETQALPLTGWSGDRSDPRFEAVLEAVRRNAGTKRRPARSPALQPKVDRRAVLAGGAVAAVAVAGVGGWALLKSISAGASSSSIAVLPFQNLSGDPHQAYFSDGVAEEIRSSLARVSGLKVVGSTSSEAVRNDDAKTAAKRLGVANILTGSVRQSPSTIRITAELIDGRSGIDRWSQDYDRAPGDTIKIQTDIAENVAGALSAALGQVARVASAVGGTQNAEAQRLFIQAAAFERGDISKESYARPLQLLDAAIVLDPRYAAAYALKSIIVHGYGGNYAPPDEMTRYFAESLRLARKALSIAPNLAEAHVALAFFYNDTLQIAAALAEMKRAVELAPSDALSIARYGNMRRKLGDTAGAMRLADGAIALDPLNPAPYEVRLLTLFSARRYSDVLRYAEQLQSRKLLIDPTAVGECLVLVGQFRDAQRYFAMEEPDDWRRLTGEALLLARSGDRAGALNKLAKLERVNGDASNHEYAQIYAQLGDKDRAFAALDRAYEFKDSGLISLRVDQFLDPLRSDPRFAALLRKMNFPA
jgi:TolB-like protein